MAERARPPKPSAWPRWGLPVALSVVLLGVAAGLLLLGWHARIRQLVSRFEQNGDIPSYFKIGDLGAQAVPHVMRAIQDAWEDRDTSRLIYLSHLLSELDMHADPSLDGKSGAIPRLPSVASGDSWDEADALCQTLFAWWHTESSRYPPAWNVLQRRKSPHRDPPP